MDDKIFQATGDSIESISSCLGFPVSSKTLSIQFKVLVPGKMAFPTISSPKMQPTDHMSTALVYFVEPNKISGALLKI